MKAKNSKLIHLSKCTCINCLKTLRSIFYFCLKILFFYRVRKHVPLTIMPRFSLVYVNQTIVRSETFSISIFSNDYYFYFTSKNRSLPYLVIVTVQKYGTVGWLVVLRLNVPVNNFSVMSGRSHRFLCN